VTPGTAGTWSVKMVGLGSAATLGGVQVTAVDTYKPVKCAVATWNSSPSARMPGGDSYRVAESDFVFASGAVLAGGARTV
jgi:hypothetical protein